MIPVRAAMKECPYCYAPVEPLDSACPKCGRQIERWQTGFHSRQQPLGARARTAVWVAAILATLLLLFGFSHACHWF